MKEEKKTSAEWKEKDSYKKVILMDPDGWDRRNWNFSFNKEKITEKEFLNRLMKSTVILNEESKILLNNRAKLLDSDI